MKINKILCFECHSSYIMEFRVRMKEKEVKKANWRELVHDGNYDYSKKGRICNVFRELDKSELKKNENIENRIQLVIKDIIERLGN